MSYELRAVIGETQLLRRSVEGLRAARLVELEQRLAMVPMTDELFDEVTDGVQEVGPGFWFLPGNFAASLARWSLAGPVAYLEAEYWGGVGLQRAAVWSHGMLALGPLTLDEHEHTPEDGTPISIALRWLGVRCRAEADEFATVGLHRHRHTEDWPSP